MSVLICDDDECCRTCKHYQILHGIRRFAVNEKEVKCSWAECQHPEGNHYDGGLCENDWCPFWEGKDEDED